MPLGKRIDNTAEIKSPDLSSIQKENVAQNNGMENNMQAEQFSMFQPEEPKYNFGEIILNSDTYDVIQDILTIYEKHQLIFDVWGLSATHKQQNQVGINLYGVPGTGKTMAAHAIAKQLGRQILTVDYSQIESKYVGETSKNLVAMFKYAKESNAIIFF